MLITKWLNMSSVGVHVFQTFDYKGINKECKKLLAFILKH